MHAHALPPTLFDSQLMWLGVLLHFPVSEPRFPDEQTMRNSQILSRCSDQWPPFIDRGLQNNRGDFLSFYSSRTPSLVSTVGGENIDARACGLTQWTDGCLMNWNNTAPSMRHAWIYVTSGQCFRIKEGNEKKPKMIRLDTAFLTVPHGQNIVVESTKNPTLCYRKINWTFSGLCSNLELDIRI